MMTLYDYGNSVCCQKVRITLVEKRLQWQAIPVDLFKSEQYDPNYPSSIRRAWCRRLCTTTPRSSSRVDLRIRRRGVP